MIHSLNKPSLLTPILCRRIRLFNWLLLCVILSISFLTIGTSEAVAGKQLTIIKLRQKLKDAINSNSDLNKLTKKISRKALVPIVSDPVLLEEITHQNASKPGLANILEMDYQWEHSDKDHPMQEEKMNNACADRLTEITDSYPSVIQAFVMDGQGAIVCMNTATKDYWHGNTDNWMIPYRNRAVYVGELKYDEDTEKTLQEISLPILNDKLKSIGAITFGIEVILEVVVDALTKEQPLNKKNTNKPARN